VLVFTRARTATLQNVSSWKQVSSLAKKLNAALDVGQSHHRLELVHRGPTTYFVTCANSPRFNWKVSLSHQDVGENLDYFAPGHMAWDTKDTKATVYMVETSSFEALTGEWVLLEYLDDERCRGEWKMFNKVRETLFNEVLARLGLEYRVRCLVVYPGMVEAVQKVMVESKPPSSKWWQDYGYFVNGFLFPGICQQANLAFCGFDTKYDMYWVLIQSAFQFMLKYKRHEYWYTSLQTGSAFWKSMEVVFTRIRVTCATTLDEKAYNQFSNEIEKEFAALGELAEASRLTRSAALGQPRLKCPSTFRRLMRRIMYGSWELKESLRLLLFERRKLRVKLSRPLPPCPESGKRNAFEWFFEGTKGSEVGANS
jgi:hypothetical protein